MSFFNYKWGKAHKYTLVHIFHFDLEQFIFYVLRATSDNVYLLYHCLIIIYNIIFSIDVYVNIFIYLFYLLHHNCLSTFYHSCNLFLYIHACRLSNSLIITIYRLFICINTLLKLLIGRLIFIALYRWDIIFKQKKMKKL